VSGVGPTEGVSGVEPTEHVSGTDPTEGVSGVDHKGGISGVESKKAVSVEESEPVEQENKTVDSEKYLSSTNLSAAEQSPLQIPNDGGPQLEQCCMVVMRCLQTSIVLIGSTQLSENIEDFRKMWKETFQCLNDINATVKLNRLGEEPASSKPSNGITVSFSGIQGHVESEYRSYPVILPRDLTQRSLCQSLHEKCLRLIYVVLCVSYFVSISVSKRFSVVLAQEEDCAHCRFLSANNCVCPKIR
jgi:hypothetical protein